MMPAALPECAAAALGIAGAVLVAGRQAATRRAGFACWTAGNLIWVVIAAGNASWALAAMFAVYWITAVAGLVNTGSGGTGGAGEAGGRRPLLKLISTVFSGNR
ncbi:MAG: hypothetical protein GKC04_02760 [Methanomicrobiales archaeon]|nr:hypothetical protein [Methanomicrobiales archaeon]